ncbi:MAG: SDR family NAD(P)-dependent oxidoreductase [Burkholderiaceae bacterium]
MSHRLEGKIAVVTGGAGGIGEATVRRFVREGARVGFCDVNAERGKALADELNQQSESSALFMAADVSREAELEALIQATAEQFGGLDILVNNAAIRNYQDVTEASTESWNQILGTNLMGFVFGARAGIALMRERGGGVVVNLASVRSVTAGSKCVQYDTSKAAIMGLTRSMARDHADDNVRVVAVGPGPIFTPFHERRAGDLGQSADQYVTEFGADTMMNRPGTAEEVANAILFLASDEASFITGTCLFVDGGQTAL